MSQTKPGAADPAEIAGRYQVLQKLGAGAFGTVYKARDKVLGRQLAIKTIRLEGIAAVGLSIAELTDRFRREAQVSAQLRHPHIVTIYDVGEADGMSYLAMEFIDGVGLNQMIASEGRLGVERAALIGAQVADALDFAHRHNVIHRDVKPANIMIEAGDRVKVTDFGIAKVTTAGEQLTVTGSLLGTPSYMSPEQARGQTLDGRSDLFAVGSILYEMLAGVKAFKGESITGLIFKIITEEPPPLRSLDSDLPDEVVRIVEKAIAKDPAARFQTGRELAEALLGLTRAGAPATLRVADTPTARSLAGAAVAGATPATVAASATLTGAAAPPAPPVPSPAARATAAPPPPPPAAGTPTALPPPQAAARGAARPAPPPRPATQPPAPAKTGLILVAAGAVLVALLLGVVGWRLLRGGGSGEPRVAVDAETSGTLTATASPEPSAAPVVESTTPPSEPPTAETTTATPPPTPEPTRVAQLPPPKPPPARTTAPAETRREFLHLDEEVDTIDGRAAGDQLAQQYGGGSRSSGSFGTSRTLNRRARSPRDLAAPERPAVATLRHVINAQELYHQRQGRYGSYEELKVAGLLFLDVPVQPQQFLRQGYRFDLEAQEDGFRVLAVPQRPDLRPFVGDDSGIIRAGVE